MANRKSKNAARAKARADYDALRNDRNVQRFLDVISYSEGTAKRGANGYNVKFGGKTFNNYKDHPRTKAGFREKTGRKNSSSAAGRYQILSKTWDAVAPVIGAEDFSPANQDKAAIELIRQKGALGNILSGDFQGAIKKLGSTWASFPSSRYAQPRKSYKELLNVAAKGLPASKSKGKPSTLPVQKATVPPQIITPDDFPQPAAPAPAVQPTVSAAPLFPAADFSSLPLGEGDVTPQAPFTLPVLPAEVAPVAPAPVVAPVAEVPTQPAVVAPDLFADTLVQPAPKLVEDSDFDIPAWFNKPADLSTAYIDGRRVQASPESFDTDRLAFEISTGPFDDSTRSILNTALANISSARTKLSEEKPLFDPYPSTLDGLLLELIDRA